MGYLCTSGFTSFLRRDFDADPVGEPEAKLSEIAIEGGVRCCQQKQRKLRDVHERAVIDPSPLRNIRISELWA
jgi:hypothetical protein